MFNYLVLSQHATREFHPWEIRNHALVATGEKSEKRGRESVGLHSEADSEILSKKIHCHTKTSQKKGKKENTIQKKKETPRFSRDATETWASGPPSTGLSHAEKIDT